MQQFIQRFLARFIPGDGAATGPAHPGVSGASGAVRTRPYPRSDHFDGQRFHTPWPTEDRNFTDLLRWKFTSRSTPWPAHVPNTRQDVPPERVHGDELRITYIGHSTTLIQTAGVNVLTDPVWSERTGPFLIGPKRARKPGLPLDMLPPIDAVLVSHNHYDHLDLPTLTALWKRHRPRIVAPLGNAALIDRALGQRVCEELDWWESLDVFSDAGASASSQAGSDAHSGIKHPGGLRVHAAPAHHWSARGVFDRRKALWCSFVLETPGGHIGFFGDTGYGSGETFRLIRSRFGSMRVALLPIGAYEPRWFMAPAHMNPEEAVLAMRELGARRAVATHHGVFKLTDEGIDTPLYHLGKARCEHGVSPEAFRVMDVGEGWQAP